jgi:hypothetical protein
LFEARALEKMPLSAPFDLEPHEQIVLLAACRVAPREADFEMVIDGRESPLLGRREFLGAFSPVRLGISI